ncbi:MAG TPA: fumarylacetoacetate hydrolase family protein [Stellaceae bacterium]|nr:fumarylacetoacetate hydrolase family protein [Stellaceae bacterium]
MRLALAHLPSPFLAAPRVIASGANGRWHDCAQVLPAAHDLGAVLAAVSALSGAGRQKLERTLDGLADGIDVPSLLKPIEPLGKILLTEGSVALARSNDQRPAKMVVGFSKFATSLADPEATLHLAGAGVRYDVEAALAAVIGRPASRLTQKEAARAIVGFTLMAEITERDMFEAEARTNNSLFAKNCPGLTPLGPAIWIGGASELDPAAEVTLSVNGAVRQRFKPADFAHGIETALRAWSRVVLAPGDMVALGAAISRPRAGNEVDSPIPLAAGDLIEVAHPQVGVLRARISL